MIKEDTFWDLWEEQKEWLFQLCGCFHTNRRFLYSSSNSQSQFEGMCVESGGDVDFLKKFIKGYLRMGSAKVGRGISQSLPCRWKSESRAITSLFLLLTRW